MTLPGNQTSPDVSAARFLLKPGRKYEEAVSAFEPYQETKEVNADARLAGAKLIQDGKGNPKRKTFIFVNNRLEGNALNTIRAMLDLSESELSNDPSLTT
jgi:hypothetical protein